MRLELSDVYGDQRITLRGPDVFINARTVLALSMAFHELATNAAKYGALSVPEGHIDVAWYRIDEGNGERLVVKWEERCDIEILPPAASGFGTQLIKMTVERSLGGSFSPKFNRSGFSCELSIPFERVVEDDGDAADDFEATEDLVS